MIGTAKAFTISFGFTVPLTIIWLVNITTENSSPTLNQARSIA
jgi:hypothetical protein